MGESAVDVTAGNSTLEDSVSEPPKKKKQKKKDMEEGVELDSTAVNTTVDDSVTEVPKKKKKKKDADNDTTSDLAADVSLEEAVPVINGSEKKKKKKKKADVD